MAKKFLDANGLTYLVSKLDDYPNNDILAAVIDGIDEVKVDKTEISGTYGQCTTAKATTAKVVSLSTYNLINGGLVSVHFTYDVPANSTMNINEKGAKPIFYQGAAITDNVITAGSIAFFVYDGTNYNLIALDDLNPQSGQVDVVNGTSPANSVEIWIDESEDYESAEWSAIITQTTGQSEDKVMSQKAVTEALASAGGGSGPENYIKSVSIEDTTLTLTKEDDTTEVFTPTEIVDLSDYSANDDIASDDANKLIATNIVKYNDNYLYFTTEYTDSTLNADIKLFTVVSKDENGVGVYVYKTTGSSTWKFGEQISINFATYDVNDVLKINTDNTSKGFTMEGTNSVLIKHNNSQNSDITISLPSSSGTLALKSDFTNSAIVAALGYTPYNATNPDGYISSINSSDVTTALGYTPYDGATNPNGYIDGISSNDVTTALGFTPYDATNPNSYITGIAQSDVTTALGYTPYNATNPDGYISSINSSDVTGALGYTPYNSTNPSGYISGINSTDVTTALGFTPYNASNPSGYISGISSSDVTTALGFTPISGISSSDVTTALGYTPLNSTLKGANSGLAELGADGKVPSSQLPSYVDDVLEYNNKAGFPASGESGKIYIAKDTNKTFRWSGSAYVEISASLALGETSSTAYAGDKGKTAYEHSQVVSGNPHNVSKSDLGLGNVENKSSATILGEITSATVTGALGYTPYNSTNPNGYVSQTTNSLNNYYTKTQVDGMVANRFQALIVSVLPAHDISTSTIYMVLQSGQTDVYDEWMYISNTWTKIGTTSIDMSEYAKAADLHNVATTGAYSSLVGKPNIPDDTADLTNSAGFITKSVNNLDNYTPTASLATVATTGSYNDLKNKPSIPDSTNDLTNDAGFIKQSDLSDIGVSSFSNDAHYATLSDISALENIDVDEINRAINATQNIGTVTQVTAGTGLSGGGSTSVTINHSNSVAANNTYPTGTAPSNGGTFSVRDVKYDAQGHITSSQDRTITLPTITEYDDTAVRGLITAEETARTTLAGRVTDLENFNRDNFTSFVFCIFGIEPYIDPTTLQPVANRYYQRSDVDTGIFMDNKKIDIHLKAWLKYHYNITDISYLKNITCYVYAMGDHGEYVNHMVTFWSQINNPSITSYPDLQQVGSFIDDGYGSIHRFSTTQVGAILSCTDDGYIAADPTGTGKGYVSGWNTLTGRVSSLEDDLGDIASVLDAINGEVI